MWPQGAAASAARRSPVLARSKMPMACSASPRRLVGFGQCAASRNFRALRTAGGVAALFAFSFRALSFRATSFSARSLRASLQRRSCNWRPLARCRGRAFSSSPPCAVRRRMATRLYSGRPCSVRLRTRSWSRARRPGPTRRLDLLRPCVDSAEVGERAGLIALLAEATCLVGGIRLTGQPSRSKHAPRDKDESCKPVPFLKLCLFFELVCNGGNGD